MTRRIERINIWNEEQKAILNTIANNPNYYFEDQSYKAFKESMEKRKKRLVHTN